MKNLIMMIVSIVWALPMLADDFNPTNPPEPYTKYKVEVSAQPYGYTSGSGKYVAGNNIWINTSPYNGAYTFSHWMKDGERYSDDISFTYTVEPKKTVFVAVYDFTPENPSEPEAYNVYRLFLTNNISSACSFNRTSGSKVEVGNYVYVVAYRSEAYDFLGWYEDGQKISDALSFYYYMPEHNATLTARFAFNPDDPDEPGGNQEDVANQEKGDLDGDGKILVSDAVEIVNRILTKKESELNLGIADTNGDGVINIADAVELTNWILQKRN